MAMPPVPDDPSLPEDAIPRPVDAGRRPAASGSLIGSRRLTAVLAVAVVVLVAIAVLPSLGLTLPRVSIEFGSGATASPTAQASEPTASATPAGSPTFVRPTPTAVPTFTSYVVKPGDSLGTIATLYRTTARSIAWWNRGTYPSLDPESPTYNPSHIDVGWTLVLMPGTVVDDANPPSPSPGRATPTASAGGSPATGASGSPAAAGSARPASPSPAASK